MDDDLKNLDRQGMARQIERLKQRLAELEQAEARRAEAEHALTAQARELRRAREVLRSSRNKLAAVFDAINDVVFALDADGRVNSVNMAAAELARGHPRQLVGLPCAEMVARLGMGLPPDSVCGPALAEALAGSRPRRATEQVDGPDGPMFFELAHTPVREDEAGAALTIVHIRDVTLQRRMEMTVRDYSELLEQKVAERTAELGRANAELRRLEGLRRDLTRMMVHDLKGPLSEVLGNLEVVAGEPLSSTQAEFLDLARVSADDLFRMILNLLDMGRLSEGRLPLNPRPLRFGELAGALVRRFATVSRLRGLVISVEDSAGEALTADEEILRRVLMNLLTNALSHTPDGGRVELRAEPGAEGGVMISVADTGEGIPPEFAPHIFEQFVQGDQKVRTSTGLGLAFCRLALKAHGGRIWFDSEPGRGATFYCWLPPAGEA